MDLLLIGCRSNRSKGLGRKASYSVLDLCEFCQRIRSMEIGELQQWQSQDAWNQIMYIFCTITLPEFKFSRKFKTFFPILRAWNVFVILRPGLHFVDIKMFISQLNIMTSCSLKERTSCRYRYIATLLDVVRQSFFCVIRSWDPASLYQYLTGERKYSAYPISHDDAYYSLYVPAMASKPRRQRRNWLWLRMEMRCLNWGKERLE